MTHQSSACPVLGERRRLWSNNGNTLSQVFTSAGCAGGGAISRGYYLNAVAAGSTMVLYHRPVTKEGYYILPENNIEVFPLAIKVTFIL